MVGVTPLEEYMERLDAADRAEAMAADMRRRGVRTVAEYMQLLDAGVAA